VCKSAARQQLQPAINTVTNDFRSFNGIESTCIARITRESNTRSEIILHFVKKINQAPFTYKEN